MKKILISKGITLNYIESDKFKTNYLSFNFVSTLCKEVAALNALIPQVLIRGTEKYPDMASIKNVLDELYAASVEGRVYRRGEYQVCGMTASWLNDKYAIDGTSITNGTLDILEELIFHPLTENGVFSEKYVDNEKNNLIDDIRSLINNKTSYAIRRCQQEMCKDEPFGVSEYGEERDVEKITADTLYARYEKMLSESRIEIFYVGDGDSKKLESRIRKMFSSITRDYKECDAIVVKRDVAKVKTVNEPCKATQGKLSLGFRTGSVLGEKDYDAFPLFVEMYGNSPVSKLFMNVREKLSLCYYCRAIPEGIKGIMVVTSGVEVADKNKAKDEILAQLESVRNGDFTDKELSLAKKSLKNGYNELNDSPAALEGWYLTRRLAGVDDNPDDVVSKILNVTKDEIVRAAKMVKLDTVYFLEGTLIGEGAEEDVNDE